MPGRAGEGAPSGLFLAERPGDQAAGVLDLPVGEQVRAGLPVLGHAEPCLVGGGQGDQRRVHLGEVRGPAVSPG